MRGRLRSLHLIEGGPGEASDHYPGKMEVAKVSITSLGRTPVKLWEVNEGFSIHRQAFDGELLLPPLVYPSEKRIHEHVLHCAGHREEVGTAICATNLTLKTRRKKVRTRGNTHKDHKRICDSRTDALQDELWNCEFAYSAWFLLRVVPAVSNRYKREISMVKVGRKGRGSVSAY